MAMEIKYSLYILHIVLYSNICTEMKSVRENINMDVVLLRSCCIKNSKMND